MDKPVYQPRLMAAPDASGQPGNGSQRILARLEHGDGAARRGRRRTTWRPDKWSVGVAALLAALTACAWLLMRDGAMHRNALHDGAMPEVAGTAMRGAAGVVPLTAAAAPMPARAPATIVTEAAAPARLDMHAAGAGALAGLHPAEAAYQIAAPPVPMRAGPAIAAGQLAAGRRKTPVAPAPVPAPTPAPADADVALLTALVAHANSDTAIAERNRAERNRDVVERLESERTGALLLRCRQLSPIEGLLCRSHICAGRWENDAACRAPSR